MNNGSLRNIIFLENFIKRSKENTLKIRQPTHVRDFDIFAENEKIEYPKKKSVQKFRTMNDSFGVIQKKYDIVRESTIFKELDSKKNFNIITNLKKYYNKFLFNSINRNKPFNNPIINSARIENNNYIHQKSTLNINEQYEMKLKNVSLNKFNYFIIYFIIE